MKRDLNIVRQILLNLEADLEPDDGIEDARAVLKHMLLIEQAGLIDGHVITWAGHDFLENVRDDTRWKKIKKYLKDNVKPVTIEAVKIASQVLLSDGII